MNTSKRYTIILSASRDGQKNLANHNCLRKYLEGTLFLDYTDAVGYYKGERELSFVIHTDNLELVQHLRKHVTEVYRQECVLVRYNRISLVELQRYTPEGVEFEKIGTHFTQGTGDGENYTFINGIDWSVAS